MESVKCSICQRTFDDVMLLSLHNEYEPCQPHYNSNSSASSTTETNLICPICDKYFLDPLVLQIHVNEDHDQNPVHTTSTASARAPTTTTTVSDQLLAQDLDRRERMRMQHERQQSASAQSYEDGFEDQDAQIARLLQEEENAQSFQEFQNRYGGSTRTFSDRARGNLERIYKNKKISQQTYEEYKDKLEDMIAQPIERAESRSSGIIPIFSRLPMGNLVERRTCCVNCDHMGSTWLDQGWSCGYKNFQMLLSSLRHDPNYSDHLFGPTNRDIPSVSYLQNLIEKAWTAGFDSDGREQLNGRLANSTKWVGPTEVMACLANLNIKTELYDFHQPKHLDKSVAYQYLFDWVRNYFRSSQENVIHPLYLQHEGHSRTIIGYEQFRNGYIRLLIFDPGTPKHEIENFFQNPHSKAYLFRRSLQSFQKPVYQILAVRGLLRPEEREAAKRLHSTKVPIPNH